MAFGTREEMETSSGVSRSASAKAPRLDRRDVGGKKRARGPPARAESRRGKARSSGDAPLGKTMAMAFLLPREIHFMCRRARRRARETARGGAGGGGGVAKLARALRSRLARRTGRSPRPSRRSPAGGRARRTADTRAGRCAFLNAPPFSLFALARLRPARLQARRLSVTTLTAVRFGFLSHTRWVRLWILAVDFSVCIRSYGNF
jgi:hypothetical protein